MFIEERLTRILRLLKEENRVTVREVSENLQVSEDTIRRDFSRLAERGLVLRTHGGIMSRESVALDPGMHEKSVQHRDEKEAIARKAADLVAHGEIIVLDAGTTTERVVKHLAEKQNLTILTDALNIAMEATRRSIPTVILGGIIRNSTLCITGPDAVEMIRHYHTDKLIMGVSAISTSRGLMTANRMEAEIKKELIKTASQVIVVADHSKLQMPGFYTFASLKDLSILVTDKGANPDLVKELQDGGVRVLLAD
ncbi:MAG TPA: DeoR/GlpR family DNA-binding transcription regulator [Spirochaetia bacterium]|nr:DeoR/GlpR family DNA-binding transcription regulator [Spirochaetia bacterium]